MGFDLETWKTRVRERFLNWCLHLEDARPRSIYTALSAATLWPLVQAAQDGGILPVAVALGGVAAGVGGNLIANQIQRWCDLKDGTSESDVEAWVKEQIATNADLGQVLDMVLERLEAIPLAQAALNEGDRQWFTQTLRDELESMGNLARFEAHLIGSGAIAGGDNAQAVGAGGMLVGGNVGGDLLGPGAKKITYALAPDATTQQTEARRRYLSRLRRHCQVLPLAALGGEEGADQDLTRDQVYIALDTTTPVPLSEAERKQHQDDPRASLGRETETRPLTALEAVGQTSRLVLLGDPGAGKSTSVRQLLACLVAVHLGEAAVPSGLSGDLLPILLTLRDLVPRLAGLELDRLSEDSRHHTLAKAVRDQVLADLERWEAGGFAEGLRETLTSGRCLLVLDGLDEVPYDLRQRVRGAADAIIREYEAQRVIITCRVRSYVGEAVLSGFQAHTLAPFDDEKIGDFVRAWYNAQHSLGRVDARQAERKAENLAAAARSGDLRELAANPMLLTTMALIHQREIGLPKERVRLYNLAVEVLLRRWQQGKAGEAGLTLPPALADVLKDDQRLRPVVEILAYEAHRSRQGEQSVADLPREAALMLLERSDYLGDIGLAAAFLDYVDQRAGLLVGRGGEPGKPVTYSFPHRTFQEYLPGCHLVGQRNVARTFFAHAGEGDFWGLAAQLGAEELLYNRRGLHHLLDLAYRLCPGTEPNSPQARRAVLWSGNMAALAGREAIERDMDSPDGGPGYLARLLPRLVMLLGSDLTAPERADAGVALAHLGDPRFRADAWHLSDDDLLGFMEIPAGPFRMGSDKKHDPQAFDDEVPQHEVTLPCYYIARYLVTVAQFRVFVEESGYKPGNEDSLHGLPNQPVVNVTWYDALEYCKWLTERLRGWEGTPEPLVTLLHKEDWRISLPSEAEWEKAARSPDGRIYPWGNDPNPNRANYAFTGINTTSVVGCFPTGASPYGCLDMAGNVWEWTRSLWGKDWEKPTFKYPYDPKDGREDLNVPDRVCRVLRGGTFWSFQWYVRCAYRFRNVPFVRHRSFGFRVVVLP